MRAVVSVFKADNYDDIYSAVEKHFELHDIKSELNADMHVVIKPNLVTDKDSVFSVTTNPAFVFAVIKYLNGIGISNITVADCPGGALLLFSKMAEVYEKCGYGFLSDCAQLNCNFESSDVVCDENCREKSFNIINVISDADYIINLPKLKTHNLTCITAGVKNLFGCIPGLRKPEFHAKYPNTEDFSTMLVELAATVKPNFTIVDAVDIMEGNGPTNGKRRHLGLTFAARDVFALDECIVDFLSIPQNLVGTVVAAQKAGYGTRGAQFVGDTSFTLTQPIVLPESISCESTGGKLVAKLRTLKEKVSEKVLKSYPRMNEKCILCMKCVKSCPKQALSAHNGKIVLEDDKCIGCFCCDECCPNGAVDIRKKVSIFK